MLESRKHLGPLLASGDAKLGERIGTDTLRFVRHFRAPVERVWNAITTPAGVAVWLGRPLAIEAVVGGAFEVAFSDEDRLLGRVLEFEPQHRLAIEWHETSNGASSPYGTQDGYTSLVTFDLSPDESNGTHFVLTHRYIPGGKTMIGFGAGWHAHLESLHALLSGGRSIDRAALYAALEPLYEGASHSVNVG